MAVEADLSDLAAKHKALDRKIQEEIDSPASDDLVIAELKRQKLKLKDEMTKIKSVRKH